MIMNLSDAKTVIMEQEAEIKKLCIQLEAYRGALAGAFHRESCKDKGLGVCFYCIEAIKKMEALETKVVE